MIRLIFLLLIAHASLAQNFTGKIHYTVTTIDQNGSHAQVDTAALVEFVCDTAVRVDQKSKIGIQTMLYHLNSDEATLLMSFSGNNYAVRLPDDTSTVVNKNYKSKCKKVVIDGIKCKTAYLKDADPEVSIIYTTKISPKLSSKFPGLKGYPVNYSLRTPEGSKLFEARKFESVKLTTETFAIPEGYKQITLNEFYELMSH